MACITTFFDGRGFAEHQLKIWDQLVKMLITLKPCGMFGSKFVHLCILTFFSHWYAKRRRGFTEHHFGWSSSFSENVHNSWTTWYFWFKFCILTYFNIVQPLVCKTVTRLHRASFWPVKLCLVKMLITLELRGAFGSNFPHLCILTLSSHW